MARVIIAALLFVLPFATSAQQLPDSPQAKAERPALHGKVFWIGSALLAASDGADMITTRNMLDRGGIELNPVLGRHPSPGRQAGVASAILAARVTGFYLTERSPHRWVRWAGRAYIGLAIADHIALAACNSRLDTHTRARCHAIPLF